VGLGHINCLQYYELILSESVSTIQLKSHSKIMPEATKGVTVLIANGKLTQGVSLPRLFKYVINNRAIIKHVIAHRNIINSTINRDPYSFGQGA
jgi:hypothetical protein